MPPYEKPENLPGANTRVDVIKYYQLLITDSITLSSLYEKICVDEISNKSINDERTTNNFFYHHVKRYFNKISLSHLVTAIVAQNLCLFIGDSSYAQKLTLRKNHLQNVERLCPVLSDKNKI